MYIKSGSRTLSGFYPNDIPNVFAFRKNDFIYFDNQAEGEKHIKFIQDAVNRPENLKRYGKYAKKHQSVAKNLYLSFTR